MGKLLSLTNDYVFKRNFGYKGEEDYPKKILTEAMDIYIIELPKVEKYGKLDKYKNLNLWVRFIRNPEVFYMFDNEKDDEELKDTVSAIEKAKENLEKISEEKKERELARLRDKLILRI